MRNKFFFYLFAALLFLSLLTPLMVYKDLLFPFVTSKAFYLRICIILALPFYAYFLAAEPKARPDMKNPLTWAVAAFWVINLMTSFTGVNLNKSLWGNFERMGGAYYLLHLTLTYFYLVSFAKMSPKGFAGFLKTAVWVAGVLSVYGVLTALGMPPWVTDPSLPRISIFFGNPIYVGSFMILPMFLAGFFALQSETPGGRVMYWTLAVLQLLAIFFSGTRGAIVGLIVGLFLAGVVYLAFAGSNKVRLIGGAGVVVFIVLAGFLYMNSNKLPPDSTLRRVFTLQDHNTESRFIQWRTALKGLPEYGLKGTGPENYYIVANKFHDPEITKYDGSWFDKPHNFLLEVLVTTGVFGLLAYLGIFALSIYAAYRGYKTGFLSLLEFILLSAGALVYQLQNLFVFDNVSASLMFYAYAAFCAYVWTEGQAKAPGGKPAIVQALPAEASYAIFGLTLLLSVYAVSVTDASAMQASADVNYGYAYAAVNPKQSMDFFESAVNNPANFDFGESSARFAESALNAAYNQKLDNATKIEFLEKSIKALESTVARVNTNPIYYQRLANAVLVRDSLAGKPFSAEGIDSLNRAIELAPRRTEARMFKAQILILGGRKDDGIALAKQAMLDAPGNLEIEWQYTVMLKQAGNLDEATKQAEGLLGKGYVFRNWRDAAWLVDVYRKNKQYGKATGLFEKLDEKNLLDQDGYWAMAQVYAEAGDKAKAAEIVKKLADSDPKYKAKAEEFLKKLGQ